MIAEAPAAAIILRKSVPAKETWNRVMKMAVV
jgi:hypothetical protein